MIQRNFINPLQFLPVMETCVSETHVYDHVNSIFQSDRMSTFKDYNQTAVWIKNKLLAYGLDDVELKRVPADGKTLLGDWITPLAWDVNSAFLEINGRDGQTDRICDYKVMPDSIILGSKSTPEEGIKGKIVLVDHLNLDEVRIDGCLALTAKKACLLKKKVFDAGGIALISYFHPFPEEGPHSVFWNNSWSDRRGGWWQKQGDCHLSGFSISPRKGKELVERISNGEEINAFAKVDASIYEGVLPFVSGRIEGSEQPEEEILVLSHLYEHGAHDNATGSGTNLEIARSIMQGIQEGKIQRPKRSLRFLFMAECYGTIAYGKYRKERMGRTLAAISLDGVGAAWPLNVHRETDCVRSPVGPLIASLARHYYIGNIEAKINLAPVEVSDTLLGDPMIGVPTSWPHRACAKKTWHTSLDTMDKVDPKVMKEMGVIMTSTLLTLASLNEEQAKYLGEYCIEAGLENLTRKKPDLNLLNHEKEMEFQAIQMINTFSLKESQEDVKKIVEKITKDYLKKSNQLIGQLCQSNEAIGIYFKALSKDIVFNRKITGHIALDPLNDKDYEEVKLAPRWTAWQVAAFWLVDGERSLGEIYRKIYGEFQIGLEPFEYYFSVLKKYQYVTCV